MNKKLSPYSIKITKFSPTVCLVLFLLISFVSSAQKKYNVIFINMDDMSIAFDAYGNSFAPCPNIARIAKHGVMFRNVYAQYSLCSPSRTSMFSGKRVRTTKITDNIDTMRTALGAGYRFLNEYFHDFGYRTECYGKWTCNHENELQWDVFYAKNSGGDFREPFNDEDNISDFSKAAPTEKSQEPYWYIDTINKKIYTTDDGIETNRFLKAIDTLSYKPYFINLGLQTHNPFTPMLKYWNKTGTSAYKDLLPVDSGFIYTNVYGNGSANIPLPDSPPNDTADIPAVALKPPIVYSDSATQRVRHAYYAEMIQADSLIGAVVDKIDTKNLWDSSVIVFFSDHGLSMGEHDGQWLKVNLFEEALRVPMIICAPGRKKGVWCDQPVELVDVFQTLTELCGLPPQGNQQGASLVPLLDNPSLPWKRCIYSNLKKNINFDTLLATSVRTTQWHYNNWKEGGEELYNIVSDPTEITNLAGNPAYKDTLSKMRSLSTFDSLGAVAPVYERKTYYRDADGDGYGITNDSMWAYATPSGYALKHGDCNDNNSTINPGAPESPCNKVDDNCNKQIDENRPVPKITPLGSLDICLTGSVVLSTNSGTSLSYQWKKNNVNIEGATFKTYKATSVGTYTVEITHKSGCSNISLGTVVYATICNKTNDGSTVASNDLQLSVSPNPSNGKFVINFLSENANTISIKIFGSNGQPVFSKQVQVFAGMNKFNIDITGIAAGVYELRVDNKQSKKIIINQN